MTRQEEFWKKKKNMINFCSYFTLCNLAAIYELTVKVMWEPQHLTTLLAFTARYRDTFTYFTYFYFTLCIKKPTSKNVNRHVYWFKNESSFLA
jgi:hypothetical protein